MCCRISKLFSRLSWLICRRKIEVIGNNNHVEKGVSIIGGKYIRIGKNFSAGKNLRLHVFDSYQGLSTNVIPELIIGNDVTFTDNCYVSCAKKITIGDGTLFGENSFVCDNFHGSNVAEEKDIPPNKRPLKIGEPVVIGKNVWIGRNVCIMPGTNIGDYAVVGANAVVTHDIPEGGIAVGVPAKTIKIIE